MDMQAVLREVKRCSRCSVHAFQLENELFPGKEARTCRERVMDRLIEDAIAKKSDERLNRMFFSAVEGRRELYKMLRETA
jgi:hypothetical protein